MLDYVDVGVRHERRTSERPIMLQRVAEDTWAQNDEIKLPGGVRMPCRATILRLSSGALVVHSPLAIDDATAKEIDALGDVRFVVAPSCAHWLYVEAAKRRYPKARVFGPPGLEKKLASVDFDPLPARGPIGGIGEDLQVVRVEGAPSMNEHAFLHARSRSLVVTDLVFNVHACSSFIMRLALRVMGAWQKPAQSRMWRFIVKDRAAAAKSAADILSWDFERIVVAHGDVVEEDARQRARVALSWMTRGAPHLLGAGSVVA
jgi:hypothetical protein